MSHEQMLGKHIREREDMGAKLYKYLSEDIFDKVFDNDGMCTIKCSLPKEFNDPIELFLTIDYRKPPEELATYKEIIGNIPQLPVTCFSKSPEILPMWAHYASNQKGFVVEVDVDLLKENFPKLQAGEVDYQDEAHDGLDDLLERACYIMKPRYAYLLQRGVFSAAYYTKKLCWSYELEMRLVLGKDNVRDVDGLLLLDIPMACVTAVIVGLNAADELTQSIEEVCDEHQCNFFKLKLGRSSSKPYFVSRENEAHYFDGAALSNHDFSCESCEEPIDEGEDTCSWCAINDDHEYGAAMGNPLRILANSGLLEGYYKSMNEIDSSE